MEMIIRFATIFCVQFLATIQVCFGVHGPFTNDFADFLQSAGYDGYNFPMLQLGANSSFGGRLFPNEEIVNRPIVFIHGNSDGALDHGTEYSSGWSESIRFFLNSGYSSSSLYAITWGDRNLKNSFARTHSCSTLLRLRRFLEAVLRYTGHSEIDIIAHSMGVTLARRIIKGKQISDDVEDCDIGDSMSNKIGTFIGIAGANYGLCLCSSSIAQVAPACGLKTGFWSGDSCDDSETTNTCATSMEEPSCGLKYSEFLMQLNSDSKKEAKFIASFYSLGDEVLGTNNMVWGRNTSVVPNSDDVYVFAALRHHELKSKTVKQQFDVITGGKSRNNL